MLSCGWRRRKNKLFSKVPYELKEQKRWCNWKLVKRDGKETKLPINADTGEMARSNDSSTWTNFDSAVANVSTDVGIGYFFKEPYIGIDLDDVGEDIARYRMRDHEDNIVSEFVNTLGSYAEISPSGEGIHIIIKGKLPPNGRRRGQAEFYDSGRFFTVTGNSLGGYSHIIDDSDIGKVKYLHKKYIQPSNIMPLPVNNHGLTGHDLTDLEVISRIHQSKQGMLFDRFLKGGWEQDYDSQSEADLAMANILAFWTAKDFGQMDRIFRDSSLMREKWDEKRGKTTYGQSTLNKAINDTMDVFQGKREPAKYIFGSGFRTEQREEFPQRSYDDTGNAQRVLDRYGDQIRYSYINKKYYVYDGSVWRTDDRGIVRSFIDATIEDMKNEKVITSEDMDEEEAALLLQRHIKRSRSNASKKNIMDELKHNVPVMPNEFDQDDTLLNAVNGYVDLTSGVLQEHDKEKMFSRQTNYEYTDNAQPDIWLDFLDDIFAGDAEIIRYIQKAIGYSMTGSTREQVMFILHGMGRNGKSVLLETISEILGSYADSIRADSLMVKQSAGVNNDIAKLQGARIVTSTEPNEGFRFDEGLIKQLTGGDTVTARFLYGEEFNFKPKFKLWVTTNHKPLIRGTDDGIWRRMVLIPFNVQIPQHKVDKDLGDKLLREAPAIIDWALEGALMWQAEGLTMPKAILEASEGYRNEMDVVEYFIQENCQRAEDYESKASDLFNAYQEWAEKSGEYKMGQRKFGMKMREKFQRKRKNDGYYYTGLRLAKNNDVRFGFIKP